MAEAAEKAKRRGLEAAEKAKRRGLALADALEGYVGECAASDYDLCWVNNQMLAEFFQVTRGCFGGRSTRYADMNVSVQGFVTRVLHAFRDGTPTASLLEEVGGIGAVLEAIIVVSMTILSGRMMSRVWVNFKEKNQGTHGSRQDAMVSRRDT
jgi:hypothetical protein